MSLNIPNTHLPLWTKYRTVSCKTQRCMARLNSLVLSHSRLNQRMVRSWATEDFATYLDVKPQLHVQKSVMSLVDINKQNDGTHVLKQADLPRGFRSDQLQFKKFVPTPSVSWLNTGNSLPGSKVTYAPRKQKDKQEDYSYACLSDGTSALRLGDFVLISAQCQHHRYHHHHHVLYAPRHRT